MKTQSKTVDLTTLTRDDYIALSKAFNSEVLPDMPDTALPAVSRISSAFWNNRTQASKLPRAALIETVSWLKTGRRHLRNIPGFEEALAKLEARLVSRPGRPMLGDTWGIRAKIVENARAELARKNGEYPTDTEIEAYLGLRAGEIRGWRWYKPGMFPGRCELMDPAAATQRKRERKRKWYKENQEKVLAKTRAWAKANPEKVREYSRNQSRKRYRENPEKYKAANRKSYIKYRDKRLAYMKDYGRRRRAAKKADINRS